MSGTKSGYEQYQDFMANRVEGGVQAYEPGTPTEYHEPVAIITPATPVGEQGDLFSYEVLTDDETRPQSENTNS
jgi:hypothetical protein